MSVEVYPCKVSHLFFRNYCYLALDSHTKDAVLIDPAWEIHKIEQIVSHHQAKLQAILLTHHHYDHINLANDFAEKYQVPVFMSKIEIDYYDFSCTNLNPIGKETAFKLGQLTIIPLFTPGHTHGAISYWIGNALFSGDTLFIEGCGICTGKGGDPSIMFDSLAHIKNTISLNTQIFPGHSYGLEPGLPLSYLLKNNIYLQFDNKDLFIDFRMRKNQTNPFAFK